MSDFFNIGRMDFLCRVDRYFVFNQGTADVIWKVLKHVYLQKLDINLLEMACSWCCRTKLDLNNELLFTQVSHSLATALHPIIINLACICQILSNNQFMIVIDHTGNQRGEEKV